MIKIKVDYENNSEWWNHARNDINIPTEIREFINSTILDEVKVSNKNGKKIEKWAKSLPLWNDPNASKFALHPLIFEEE